MTIIPIIALGIFGGSASRNSSDDKGVSLACEQLMTFTSTAGRPIVLVCGSARPKESVGDWDNAKGFMYFLDGETHEVIKELLLPEVTGRVSLTDGRQFADGTFYVILNKTHLYAIDRSTLDVNEIHGEDYKRPEFTEGFGEVELYYSQYGDALQGKTNLGQSFIYYPSPISSTPRSLFSMLIRRSFPSLNSLPTLFSPTRPPTTRISRFSSCAIMS